MIHGTGRRISRRTFIGWSGAGLGLTTAYAWLRQSPAALAQQTQELTLVSFAVTKAAHDRIIPKFVAEWRKKTGQTVRFRQSYAGSGAQARAVIDGLEADLVHLAIALDTDRIQRAGLIQSGYLQRLPNNSIVTRSVPALIFRRGNPKGIKGWADLAKPGIRVITANPKTSGVARWNYLALWGSVTETGGSEAKAREYVTSVYRNAPVLPRDAREATDIFLKQGQGDVLINYENEILLALQQGQATPFLVPPVGISIDNPLAVVDRYVDKHKTRAVAEAFAQFLYTPVAQRDFAAVGFRPVEASTIKATASQFPKVNKLYTVADLGGWDAVQKKFFADGAMFDQIQASLR
ncbi:MAG: sulfate ABC transporter substrate-binding protein [Gloeomargaritaceae cyanobacterium C42_A2020_066]|nr:sulfate ABC transporter substrate-binding protein [Gloeomargaritaceae cyanobacterium C42_A2020_066]